MSDKYWLAPVLGPTEVSFDIVDGNEYAILHADTFRTAMRERDALRSALAEMLESFTEPEDDNDILRRARAALGP